MTAYAAEHDIDTATLGKLSIAIIVYSFAGRTQAGTIASAYIKEELSVWLRDFSIADQKSAEQALGFAADSLAKILK